MRTRLLTLALGALLGGGLYLLAIDTTSLPELYVLGAVAIVCGIAFTLSREQGFAEPALRPRMVARAWRLLGRIPADIVLVCREALAQLVKPVRQRGQFRACEFAATGETPEHVGRRALAEAAGSLAPNTIVIGVDAERRLLLVHQLRRQGPAEKLDVLSLG